MFYNPMHKIQKFHAAFRVKKFWEVDKDKRRDMRLLRARLILEEAFEVIDALGIDVEWRDCFVAAESLTLTSRYGWPGGLEGLEHLAKELADLKVVTYGTDDGFEIPSEATFNEVMRSNMSKLDAGGNPVYREDGKVLKSDQYREADIHGVLTGEWL